MIRRCLIVLLLMPGVALAQERQPEDPFKDLEAPISKALAYLAKQQQPDGSFQNRDPNNPNQFTGPKIALTGLTLLAFLSTGRTPDTGKHGLAVRNAIEFLVKSSPDDGYYGRVDNSRMYGHAIATLALAEACGTSTQTNPAQRKRVRAALAMCVKVILDAQNIPKDDPHAGGWRYEPASTDSDLSVTAWCAIALKSAQNAGHEVPKDATDRAANYILRCYHKEKGFAYQPTGSSANDRDPTPAMTAAAMLTLHLLNHAAPDQLGAGAKFLLDHRIDNKTQYPYYARYYTTHAALQTGGETWTRIWRRNRTALLEEDPTNRQKEGPWPKSPTPNEPGQTYATAMAVLTLSAPLRLLPTYQR